MTKVIQNSPETTWIFDLDNTLYPEKCNLFSLIDLKMAEYLSNLLQVDRIEARRVQKDYFVRYGTTLQGLIKVHNVDPEDFLNFVHDIDLSPLEENKELSATLGSLQGRKFVFTNGDVPYATRVLERLGIYHQMDGIFDIAKAGYIPKPNARAYERFIGEYDINPLNAVMFEDMARNLIPASNLGMTTVWVRTASEWAGIDYQAEHIHYETEHIMDWFSAHLEEA
ncbi:MAG: pyrimidine 5'-nucleotidase [Sphingomonadales bacterium]